MKVKKTDRVNKLLSGEPTKKKVRTSLMLEKAAFDRFKKLCKSKGETPSAVVNAFILDVLDEHDGK